MTAAHLHLAVVHVPVVGGAVAIALLVWARLRREPVLESAACVLFIACALASLLAYFSGPPAWERIEAGAGARAHELFERHGVVAKGALLGFLALGLLAGQLLLRRARGETAGLAAAALPWLALVVLYGVAWAAYLGGLIRHPELDGGFTPFPWTG